jgi:hypothetical protein
MQVLKCLGILGRGNRAATEVMTDILAKVAAVHANVPTFRKGGRTAGGNTSGAVGTEAAATIMMIEPVPMLRNYAVQIMASFLKREDNNMRCPSLSHL